MGDAATSLGHVPAGDRWEFDGPVTDVFDDMLRRSIPQHDEMRRLVHALSARYVRPGTDVVDLGCSRGEAVAALVEQDPGCRFVLVERSAPMLAAVRARYADEIGRGLVEVHDVDLRAGFPRARASVVLSVLALQFTPIEHRLRILSDAYRCLAPGGALIIVEKVIGAGPEIDLDLRELYHAEKRGNGYTDEEVRRKAMSLEGVLVPVTAGWNEDLLRLVGFRQVDCFWRWLCFAGWLAVRE